ncbi:hypothetical protein CC86DRAFT_367994 [Ophiobolus disseminans]|uniref:BZIP domain-containing protein n=1 Tax=Ophiobolus disseminans TaxID=1469910 RepID=A0A6A7AC05_9PLEO|nr:hypothetical protein CC86DRAFT_367994 [Ophiobolus disseminans]
MSSEATKSAEKEKDAAYLKRREQVRKAQRTHRQRKENYIKALEDQLFQMRARERDILKENEALTSEVTQLRTLVGRNEPQEQWSAGDAWSSAAADTDLTMCDSVMYADAGWQAVLADLESCAGIWDGCRN